MSWDGYIDTLIGNSKDASGTAHCDKAAIIGLDGGASWTTAAHANALKLTPQEGVTIAKALKSGDLTGFQANGLHAENVKYQFLRSESPKEGDKPNIVFGKKKDKGAITIQSSKTAIVIGHCAEGCQQGNVNKAVGVIADYLEDLGM